MWTRTIAALAVAASLVAASPAAADSIAYIKDGNVWLSTSDGSRQFQVTAGGGYSDVTQADDGTMVALTGVRLHKLDRQGNVLADFDTPVSDTRPKGARVFDGPYDPAISPDGSKLAYTYYYTGVSQDPTCFPPRCATVQYEGGTGYSYTDRQTGWDEPGLGKHSGWLFPSWIDNENTLLTHATHWPNKEVVLDQVGDGPALLRDWFTDTTNGNDNGQMAYAEMNRQKTKIAILAGAGDQQLRIYKVRTFPHGGPHGDWGNSLTDEEFPYICGIYGNKNGEKFGPPSWSPDGTQLAYSNGDGIETVTIPDWSGDTCSNEGFTDGKVIIPGASQPDWGPADVPPARPEVPKGALKVSAKKASLRKTLRRGLKVTVQVPGAGAVAGVAKRGSKVLASGSGHVDGAGAATLTLRFTKKAKRTLARKRRAKVTVRVGFSADGTDKAQYATTAVSLG
jgi:hypothetical protein